MEDPTPSPGPVAQPAAQTLQAMADALHWPLLLLRPDGGLLQANRAGRRLLAGGHLLVLGANGQVVPTETARTAAFNALLEMVSVGGEPQMLRWPGGAVATLAAVTGAALAPAPTRRHGVPPEGAGAAVLMAFSAPHPRPADMRLFAVINGLSAAETRLLERLALGDGTAHAAAALGLRAATVRRLTATLRRKTGHDSVAALLQTLAGLPPLGSGGGADRPPIGHDAQHERPPPDGH